VADLALSESLLDLINSTGSHETPSFHVSSPRVRLTGLTRYTRRYFPETPRDLRKFPGRSDSDVPRTKHVLSNVEGAN
jgi:hypothetical protein